jgi:hypothetical protein
LNATFSSWPRGGGPGIRGQIHKGAGPLADLPVEQATKFELVVNRGGRPDGWRHDQSGPLPDLKLSRSHLAGFDLVSRPRQATRFHRQVPGFTTGRNRDNRLDSLNRAVQEREEKARAERDAADGRGLAAKEAVRKAPDEACERDQDQIKKSAPLFA